MNSNGKHKCSTRAARVSIGAARVMAAALILASSVALAWATSRSNGSRADADIKPGQPKSLHTKSPLGTKRHGSAAGHRASRQAGKLHGNGQQGAQPATARSQNSTRSKHGNHVQADITPTPTPEETPTATPRTTPLESGSQLSVD